MERVTARFGKQKKDNKSDGSFKFAISLIVFTLTILYKSYNYIETNPIPLNTSYVFFSLLIINITTLLSMSIYIFTKAMSLEVKNLEAIEELNKCAHNYYFTGLVFGYVSFITYSTFCLAMVVVDTASSLLNVSKNSVQNIVLSILIFLIAGISVRTVLNKPSIISGINLEFLKDTVKVIAPLLFIGILISLQLFNGNTIIEMNDIYSKQNEQIPIDITFTGLQYNDLAVNLSKIDLNNDLKIIDSVKMKSSSYQSKVISSEYLIGKNLGSGKFKFYINCTNLSEGYYEISITTGRDSFKRSLMKTKTNSFYLIETKE